MKNKGIIVFLLLIAFAQSLFAQEVTNLRKKTILVANDTIVIDSLSIVPQSESITQNGTPLNHAQYDIDAVQSLVIIKDTTLTGKEIHLTYRVFPLSFSATYAHKKITLVEKQAARNPFLFEYSANQEDIFYLNGLNKSGSISRGVVFGNNQDLSVNSSLNLQLSGKVSDDVAVLASISDDNIPIQAEGNTQQLQEFDRVYMQLFSESWKLTAGDYYLERPESYFMNFNKKVKGGSFEMTLKPSKKEELISITPTISAAISKGKFSRNIIQGVEGNQGPYRLTGADNEAFIIILSGTEKVYIDGRLLKRGNEFDYVIDYNTAELTFTANRLITKDSRIVAEFQYSDKNYSRSLVHFGNDYITKKLRLSVNVYSEQDARNQPLQQELNDSEKVILSTIGDSLKEAIVPNVAVVPFSDNNVLYKKIDTLGFTDVYVYATHPDSAKYQLGFSFLGENSGDYVQTQSIANGKVYEWVAPINGIKQGEYDPVVLLVTPKTQQMATFGGQYNFRQESFVSWEGAVANTDLNTFSDQHDQDNIGYALKVNAQHKIKLSDQKNPWKLKVGSNYEFVDRFFSPIERFRTVEFSRDWNINNVNFNSNQHVFNTLLGIEKLKKADIFYDISVLKNEQEFEGIRNALFATYDFKGFLLKGDGSFLTTQGVNNSTFFRHKGELSKQVGFVVLGVGEETEKNAFFVAQQSDSLQANSFEFTTWNAFVHNADTTINKFELSYKQRTDKTPLVATFIPAMYAEDITFSVGLLKNSKHQFRGKATYRKLMITAPSIVLQPPEENVLARVEYVAKFLKNSVTSNTYYEVGSGLEVKKEFLYVEVQPGQGTHAYIGDLNNNGVKDLDEFDIAAFQDQATFIKIFTPTNDYVKVFNNQFNQSLFLRPETNWANEKGIKRGIARFSNRTNYRISRKVNDKIDYFNPFITTISDTSLVTLNSGFLNTIYFNRTGTKFGTQFTFQDNKSRSLLTNGIEVQQTIVRAIKTRWNITKMYLITWFIANGEKWSNSEFFKAKNYAIEMQEIEPKLTFQPSPKFSLNFLYNYKEKTNALGLGGEELKAQKGGIELRLNRASKGSFRAAFNYIENTYVAHGNAALDYEMLEGLQPGTNVTCELTYQQNISKHMQLSLNYNGRKSEDSPIIHTGGVQVRAFF